MKIQSLNTLLGRPVTEILTALLAVFWAVTQAAAGDVQMAHPSDRLIEVTGGSGREAWRLQFRTQSYYNKLLVTGQGGFAWFSHGGWLRLIDTKKGIVGGRWRFPGQIVGLVPAGHQIRVEVEDRLSQEQTFRRIFTFDPSAPIVPYWPNGWLLLYRLPETEWASVFQVGPASAGLPPGKAPTVQARKLIPLLEEAARRDPCSPWLRVLLGNTLRAAGDARAGAVFQQAVRIPTSDFTELLRLSNYLENLGERDAARAAFERGYRDFLDHGNDPRIFNVLIGKAFLLGSTLKSQQTGLPIEERRELIERTYMLQPYGESAELAWNFYAQYLHSNGRLEEAQVWRERTEEARAKSLIVSVPGFSLLADRFLLLCSAAGVAVVIYFLLLYVRYLPQHRLAKAAQERSAGLARGRSWLNTVYWDRRQRVGFFSMMLVFFFSAGMIGQYIQGILRFVGLPLGAGMGSLGGPVTTWYLENRLPRTPERDLLLAIAYQQSGENEKAARLYRSLPQFAESWNNLGVILKDDAKEGEAHRAFEKALELDPGLAEAALNLGRPARSFWTELHQKYVPGRPMLTPPQRERMVNAFLGGSPRQVYLRAFLYGFSGGVFGWIGRLAG